MTSTLHFTGAARVAAVVAGLGLVAASFAPIVSAQTTTTTTTTTSATFTRDLTLGSTGADVTALQNWLISKGHSIAAGATGYFGAQTRAALAAWQAANGVMPAAGYFGPITRARIAAAGMSQTPVTTPAPMPADENDNNNEDEDLSIEVEIRSGRAYVEAEVDGDTERFTLSTTNRSTIVRDTARRLDLSESEVREVIQYESEDEDETSSGNSGTTVRSSARAFSVDGADNDYATFEIRAEIEAFGEDSYIPTTAGDAFTYQIEDASTGAVVGSATAVSATISSTADTQGSSYRISEGDREEFVFTVNFNPLASDEGKSFRLQLLTVAFGDQPGSMTDTLTLRPESRYETEAIYIAD